LPESRVESAAAEQAKADIRLLYDDYRIAKSVRKQRRGRIRLDDFADRQDQLLLVSVVGVAEHFALDTLVERGGSEKKARDWDGHVKEWMALGVDMPVACPSLAAVRGFYEARTSIAHAGGSCTTGQMAEKRHKAMLAYLAAARISHVQHRVLVNESTAKDCVDACLAFVDEVEALRLP
jgi:hypothetical protein